MDKLRPPPSGTVVSPYLMQPMRDLHRAQLESIIRKAWADNWTLDLDETEMASSAHQAAQAVFPDLDRAAVAEAMRQLGLTGRPTS